MALLFKSSSARFEIWRKNLLALDPALEIRQWPQAGNPDEIEFALIWDPRPDNFHRFRNLKAIFALGAGVDFLVSNPLLPADVPVIRIVDPELAAQVTEYAIYGVLHFHRRMEYYRDCQAQKTWAEMVRVPSAREVKVSILGAGLIGSDIARKLAVLGFQVRVWSRTPKEINDVTSFCGNEGLLPCLLGANFLVCVLPLTRETRGILNQMAFEALAPGSYIINAGRGAQIVEDDLLSALQSGHISGALLDVFNEEPLPKDHPFWRLPNVLVTPHVAGDADPHTAAMQVIDNVRRARSNLPLRNVIDSRVGY